MAVWTPGMNPWGQQPEEQQPSTDPLAAMTAGPNPYTAGPMEQQAMNYWQQQIQQPYMTPEQTQQFQNIYAAGMSPQATARLEEGMGQYMRGGQSGAGREFIGQTVAGYEGALRQGMAGNQLQIAQQEAQNRMGLAGMGFQGAGTLGQLQYQQQQGNVEYHQYQQQLAEEKKRWEEWLASLSGLYGGSDGGGMNTGTPYSTPSSWTGMASF